MKAPGVTLVRRKVKNRGRPVIYWELRWPGCNGKTRSESIGRVDQMPEADAAEIRRQKIVDLGVGKAPRDPSRMTLAEFLDLDRESIATSVRPSSLACHRTASAHAIAAIGHQTRLDRIGWREVTKLRAWLSQEHEIGETKRPPCRPATINKTVIILKAAWNRAVRRGLVAANPFASEKLARVQRQQKRIFSAAEVEAMVEAAPNAWWRAFIRLAFTTGLRLGEILSLTWDDVQGNQVAVSAKRAGQDRLEWSAKSHHERRVPLCPETAERLEPLRLSGGGSPYLFIGRDRLKRLLAKQQRGRLPQPSHWLNNLLREYRAIQTDARATLAEQRKVELAEVRWRAGTIHDLRRSFGTHMAQHVPMHELCRLMGHASITTTADFYLGVSDDVAAKIVAAFAHSA